MAGYSTTAQVTLTVNGKQAEQILKTLEKDAEKLRKKMDEAAKIGDKGAMKKLQRELKALEAQIKQIKGASSSVEDVLKRLDKASPKELKNTLSQLRKELNNIERGSEAWNKQVARIRAVQTELNRVRASMNQQQSGWDRMNNWLNNCQTALLGIVAALTGLIAAARKSVNIFAEHDDVLANTRKYTGLAAEQVDKMNDVFKKIDTRTPIDKLHDLAQEAGRLGKNTMESVQGYVEAADIINVALVDLGAGATQTIAKLTNIFGVEQLLGTKDAMLAVGSTVNVLSQNCTASKPYLVEFAQRMAGIGSQAGMTIPQILAFGAVLDANGQKVEMSATAIQKVIMNLANKNHEFAATVGIDAEKLNATLKESAVGGLLMFLEALQSMGKNVGFNNATMTLAPAFKEMGLDAARVSQVLSTLAMHLDEVKWQLGEADKAFAEATSATNEYQIFNNTAQAAIDKAKKSVTDLAIELGQKLYPAMKHIYTSSGVFLRVLNQIVSFFICYKVEILTAVGAIAAYNAVMAIQAARTAIATAATSAFNTAVALGSKVIPAFNVILAAGTNAIQYFTNGLRISHAMQERWSKAMGAMKLGNWVGLILTATAALVILVKRLKDSKTAAEEMAEARQKIESDAIAATKTKITMLDQLYKKTQDQTSAEEERLAAVNKLRAIYPDYFKDLTNEAILAGNAAGAYRQLRDSILESARAKGRESRIEELEKEIQQLESEYEKKAKPIREYTGNVEKRGPRAITVHGQHYESQKWKLKALDKEYGEKIGERKKEQERLAAKNLAYELNNHKDNPESTTDQDFKAPSVITPQGNPSAAEDRFKDENEWRTKAEAMAKIMYSTGIANEIEYQKAMDSILVEYNQKKLQHEDLTETERLQITADFADAVKKQEERYHAISIEDENLRYNEAKALLKQYYADDKISKKAYEDFSVSAEAEHLQTLINLHKEGSQERLKAEDQLNTLLIQQMEKRRQETERLEKDYAKVKDEHFGMNAKEKEEAMNKELSMLEIVYNREIDAAGDNAAEKLRIEEAYEKAKLAIRKKYGMLSAEEYKNAMQKGVMDSIAWLNSDGGQAVVKSFETITSGMASIFSQLSSLMQSELEIQTNEITKRYDKEIKAAEGNSYQVAVLEKKKQEEISKVKNEANKKMFAVQVIQAVAQTATAALNAYSSAAAIPVTGWIMAPIAAAMALAAGAVQIAAIKKQQQASASQGYAEGGFTKEGGKYEPAGIVHAGEWVASQSLVKNPQVRPLLEALDYAQHSGQYPVLSPDYVSMRMAAPAILAQSSLAMGVAAQGKSPMHAAVEKLNQRLEEPFVSVATIAGDKGIERAKQKYDRLMKNKR